MNVGSFLYEWREVILLGVLAWFVLSYTPAWLSSSSNLLATLSLGIPILIGAIIYYFATQKGLTDELPEDV